MKSLYFVETDNYDLLINETKNILKEEYQNYNELIKYDLSIKRIDELLEDINTYGFFQETKLILGYNFNILGTEKSELSKEEIEEDFKKLENYINNYNPNSILILHSKSVDSKKNIVKLIKKSFTYIKPEVNYRSYIKDKFNNYKIDTEEITYLLEKCGENITKLDSEIEKLKLYKLDSKIITKDDINNIVVGKVEDNIYDLTSAIIEKNKKKALLIYNDLKKLKLEDIIIVVTLAKQMKLMYEAKVIKEDKYFIDKGISSGRLYHLRKDSNKFSEKELLNNIHELTILDEKIKSSTQIDNLLFSIFIANL